jgi:ABC-2 type transport system permease protein
MTTISAGMADFRTMLRRNARHTGRNPVTVFNAIIMPIFMMLMFVYVFGDAFSVGVNYVDYATPGLIMMTIAYGVSATAIAANSDMATGFINRFRVMDVSGSAVLTAHVIASMVRSLVAIAEHQAGLMKLLRVWG